MSSSVHLERPQPRPPSLQHSAPPLTGTWEPLAYILYGFATAPFEPSYLAPPAALHSAPGSHRHHHNSSITSQSSARNRFSWSGIPPADKGKAVDREINVVGNEHEQALQVGDEIYAFERFVPDRQHESDIVWYRGYVSTPPPITQLVPAATIKDPSSSTSALSVPQPDPSVYIGIFPSSHFHVREHLQDAEHVLAAAYAESQAKKLANDNAGSDGRMAPLREVEDEELPSPAPGPRSGSDQDWFATGSKHDPVEEHQKHQPPLPNLKAGGETLQGRRQPLVDEIACAIRDWYLRLPVYLQRRQYRLFDIVHQHIDALHMGRTQLLAQTLSAHETALLKKECVARLVKGNIAQGLDIIVRHPVHGALVTVDPDALPETMDSWLTGVRMYAMQVAFAYIDVTPLDAPVFRTSSIAPARPTSNAAPVPSNPLRGKIALAVNPTKPEITSGAFYQCFLDVRAFIASPCAPGETAELYFSLYSKSHARFLTEEYCLILNHLGSPARNPESRFGRLRTLFTDLSSSDLADGIYLVCRLVRNGGMKMASEASSAGQPRDSVGRRESLKTAATGTAASVRTTDRTEDSFSVTSGHDGDITPEHPPSGDGASSPRIAFRRPLGCSVLELKQLIRMVSDPADATAGGEFTMPIYVPRDEAGFATLHEDIIHGRSKEYECSARAEAIAVSFRVFHGVASTIISSHPSLLLDVPLTARLGFPDVVYPGSVRNDLYVKLWSGSFTQPASTGGSLRIRKPVAPTSHSNVQVSVEVRRSDGTPVRDALYAGGSGEPPVAQYQSLVFSHNERPTYGELVKVVIPGEIMPDCHLFFMFRNRMPYRRGHLAPVDPSGLEHPFAFAYLPLCTPQQACLQDGSHNLVLYRMEKNMQIAPSTYFTAPSVALVGATNDIRLDVNAAKSMLPLKDRFSVRTFLCSTQHTQSDALLALLDWQKRVGGDTLALLDTLKAFAFVSEEEIVKFLPDIFEALFGILGSKVGEKNTAIDEMVFQDLLGVLSIVSDRRFHNFRSVLDVYIDGGHFSSTASSWQILRQMKRLCENPKSQEFRQMLKVWDHLCRFVVKCRELDRAKCFGLDATSAHMDAEFKRQLKAILQDVNALMASTDPSDIGAQTLAVQHFADVLPAIAPVFRPIELAEIIIDFANTLGNVTTGKIAIWKLLLLSQVVRCVFGQSDARTLLVPALVRWVKPHLGRYNQLVTARPGDSQEAKDAANIHWLECNRLAVTALIVALMLDKLQEWLASPSIVEDRSILHQEEDNVEYCLTLMPRLLDSYHELNDPQTANVIDRHAANTPISKAYPDVFPSTYPFALVVLNPDSSLSARGRDAAEVDESGKPLLNCGLGETAVTILVLIMACPRPRLNNWLEDLLEIEGPRAVADLLRNFFDVALSILQHEAFPANWLNTNLMAHTVVLKLLGPVAALLEKSYVPSIDHADSFNTLLWGDCLNLLCELLASEELVIEEFSAQKRRAVWKLAGDLRGHGASILLQLWNALGWPSSGGEGLMRSGGYQVRFVFLVEQIITLCLSHHDQLRITAVDILFSMIASEYERQGGSFPTIESEVFAKLDKLFANSREGADPVSRAYFVTQLRAVFEASGGDTTFRSKVNSFLNDLEAFLDLLLSLKDLPDSAEWTDERAGATLRLMDFIRRIGREDMYIAHVHQLVQSNVDNEDWLGAGLALKLHADLYQWTTDGDVVEAFEYGKFDLPPQTQFARKESLYYLILDYLGQAEAYEIAIDICQELAKQHEIHTFNYGRLSDLLTHQARLYERINDTTRQFPEYFRIAYFGGFPDALRGKQFIARGRPWQKFASFCEALQAKHPSASLHRSMIPPSEVVQNGEELVIWVTSLMPEPDLSRPVLRTPTVSENIQSYWRHCDVDTFSCQCSYRSLAHGDGGNNDLLDVWVEKTILTASHRFPHALGRADIIAVRTEQISPLSGALQELNKVTASMATLADKYRILDQTGEAADTRRLSMALNSAVDSPISGGVPAYRKAFLDPSYLDVRPQDAAQVEELREAILAHVQVIEACLELHERLRPPEMASFHGALVGFYHRSFPDDISTLKTRRTIGSSVRSAMSSTHHRPVRTPSITAPVSNGDPAAANFGGLTGPNSLHSSGKVGDYQLPALQMYPGTYDTSLIARQAGAGSPVTKNAPATPSKSTRASVSTETGASPVKPGVGTRSRSFVGSLRSKSPAGSYVNVPAALGGAPHSAAANEAGRSTDPRAGTAGKKEGLMRFGSLLKRRS